MSSLTQKTIISESRDEFDKLCNDFKTTHDVKFEQTHVVPIAGTIQYIAVMFYEVKK